MYKTAKLYPLGLSKYCAVVLRKAQPILSHTWQIICCLKVLWFIYLFSNSSSAGISKSVLWFQLTSHICHLLCVWLWDWQEELTFQRAVIEKYPSPHSSLCSVSLTEVYWRKLPKVLQCISWNSKKGAAQDFCKHFYHGKHWPQSVFFPVDVFFFFFNF